MLSQDFDQQPLGSRANRGRTPKTERVEHPSFATSLQLRVRPYFRSAAAILAVARPWAAAASAAFSAFARFSCARFKATSRPGVTT